jgi:hypothetical protein
MSSFISFGAGGATQPLNPDIGYERLGYGTDGSMTTITASGSANTLGSYTTVGATATAWCGLYLDLGKGSNASNRYLVYVRINGTTILIQDIPYIPGAAGSGVNRLELPLQVPSGATVEVAIRSNTGSATLQVAVSGIPASTSLAPGYTSAVSITTPDTSTSRPSTIDVPLGSTASYTQLNASTSEAYGAILVCIEDNGTNPATAQQCTLLVATGAAASEVPIGAVAFTDTTAAPIIAHAYRTLKKAVASGTRMSAAALATTPGTDKVRVSLHGFK